MRSFWRMRQQDSTKIRSLRMRTRAERQIMTFRRSARSYDSGGSL